MVMNFGAIVKATHLLPPHPPKLSFTFLFFASAAFTNHVRSTVDEGSSHAILKFASGIPNAKSTQSRCVKSFESGGNVFDSQSG